MADDTSAVVSRFFLKTCRRRDRVNRPTISALMAKIDLQRKYEFRVNPLTTGSAAELYIDPMLPCIGDTDIMFHLSRLMCWQYRKVTRHLCSYQLSLIAL